MSDGLVIVTVAPEVFNPNGDAENARVLARRCEWAGIDAVVAVVSAPEDVPERVDAVVIGSCSDSQVATGLDVLRALEPMLRDAVGSDVPVLAVGTGLELLGETVEFADGRTLPALGLVAARAVARRERATGDLVVDSADGVLVGYENHARDLLVSGETLGVVRAGTGNGSGRDGLIAGSITGTHLHGPVLAKNPGLADRLLASVTERIGMHYERGTSAVVADGYAEAARAAILKTLKLSDESALRTR